MTIRTLGTISLALVALALPAAAHAATPAQIHADAADGTIDGSYSMSELRAADRSVGAEQREYYGWDDAYREHVRGLTQQQLPTATPDRVAAPVPSVGGGGGGGDAGRRKPSPEAGAPPADTGFAPDQDGSGSVPSGDGSAPDDGFAPDGEPAEDPVGTDVSAAQVDALDLDDGSGGLSFLPLLIGIPLLVLAIGAWRMRQRTTRDRHQHRAASRG